MTDEYLSKLYLRGSRPGLSRIAELLDILGRPLDSLRIIHVAGTNGKGSVCAMLSSILTSAGYKTGMFSSPALEGLCSCFSIDGEPISKTPLYALTKEIISAEALMPDKPTEFEVHTALAFLYFSRSGCDYAVIETGMGGSSDATNCLSQSEVSVITDIALDHTAWLGNTIAEIAAEKAGIIKDGCPVVFGGDNPEAMSVIKAEASRHKAELYTADRSRVCDPRFALDGTVFSFGDYTDLSLSLPGVYQPGNAAVALTVAQCLREQGARITEQAVRRGLSTVRWPGRFEQLRHDPVVVYDGAHNPQGAEKAAAGIRACLGGRVIALMGVMSDKDHAEMVNIIAPLCRGAFTVTPKNPRALSADRLAEEFAAAGIRAFACGSIGDGVRRALKEAARTGLPLFIFGTLYFYSDVKAALDSL